METREVRDWKDIRYRGDARDEEELYRDCRIANFLTTSIGHQRQQEQGLWNDLLGSGILLSGRISPHIYRHRTGPTCRAFC